MIPVSRQDARRLLLAAQGLSADPDRRATTRTLDALVQQMGFVQVDTIRAVERAHHLTLFSRLHGYQPAMLTTLLETKRTLWEHWTHDASAIPVAWFPHWRHRFDRYQARIRRNAWWKARLGDDPDLLLARVLERIETDGPLLCRDFERETPSAAPAEDGWWGWKPEKAALEHLWRSGRLVIEKRIHFQKVWDLPERVYPEICATPAPPLDAHVDWACVSALERLGVATPSEIRAFWDALDLTQVRAWCEAATRAGMVVEVSIEGEKRKAYALASIEETLRRAPEPPERLRLLSPFDPIVRDRARALRLFGFDYRFEAFVPAPQRKYGYYVMPLLEGDRLVGRVHPKVVRDRGQLQILGTWWEPGIQVTRARQRSLDEALLRLAAFVGVDDVVTPG